MGFSLGIVLESGRNLTTAKLMSRSVDQFLSLPTVSDKP